MATAPNPYAPQPTQPQKPPPAGTGTGVPGQTPGINPMPSTVYTSGMYGQTAGQQNPYQSPITNQMGTVYTARGQQAPNQTTLGGGLDRSQMGGVVNSFDTSPGGPDPGAGTNYTEAGFRQWVQTTFGQAGTPQQLQQVANAVGPPAGPNGTYTEDQWRRGQQEAERIARAAGWPGPSAPTTPTPQQPQGPMWETPDAPGLELPEYQQPGPFNYREYESGRPFEYGEYQRPEEFQYGEYERPEDFSYREFEAPNADTLRNDPGYQFRLEQGQKGVERSAAARGMARTGNSLVDLTKYSQGFASDEFGKAFDRSVQAHQLGYGQASDTYDRNSATGRYDYETNRANAADVYDRNSATGRYAYETNRANAADIYDRNESNRFRDYTTNRTGAAEDYDRNAATGRYAHESAVSNATSEYAPELLTWQERNAANQRQAELRYDRDWQRELYQGDDDWRRYVYSNDDAWRRYQEDQMNRRFLVEQGNR